MLVYAYELTLLGVNMQDNDIIKIITEKQSAMSKGHRAIASYIADHYDTVAFITASRLGELVGVSESTVVRFACALGYDGYPELQKKLQELIKTRLTNVQRMGLGSDMTEPDLVRTALRTDITSLRHVKEVLDYDMVAKAADMILAARQVYILGLRASAPLAQFFWYYLNYIIPNVSLATSSIGGDIFGQLMHAGSEDLIVAISFPRYSSRTVEGVSFAKNNGGEGALHHRQRAFSTGSAFGRLPVRQHGYEPVCGFARRAAQCDQYACAARGDA
jgi:DNA-binding MurR/RpiR family transcriptional regulator